MNSQPGQELAQGLQQLASKSDSANRLFKSFRDRKYDARETPVARAAQIATTDYGSMLRVFRKLEGLGAGRLIEGRHGHPSRMHWKYSIRSLGRLAAGSTQKPEEVPADAIAVEPIETENGRSTMIHHEFQLRDGVPIAFDLPADFSEKEAERLSAFVKTLPF